jgi:ketosteroid isomerase-like protein
MALKDDSLHRLANSFIDASNAFDVERVLALFTRDAVIDDPSTGQRFEGQAAVRDYIQQFFVGYHTVTRLLSIQHLALDHARLRVDFTGDFGHEVGLLEMKVNEHGLIVRIDADLE